MVPRTAKGNRRMDQKKREIIIITHPVHERIECAEVAELVSKDWEIFDTIEISPGRFSLGDASVQDFHRLARVQERLWQDRVAPSLAACPNAAIAYFGLAPIPLIFHLGSLIEGLREVVPYHRHHDTKMWSLAVEHPTRINAVALPKGTSQSEEPVALTVGVTASVDRQAFQDVVGKASAFIEITAVEYGVDNMGQVETDLFCREFSLVLGWLEAKRSRSVETHINAAIPCGLAFALGAQVTRTRNGAFVLYQYARPSYKAVLRIPLPLRTPPAEPTPDQFARAQKVRSEWESSRKELVERFGAQSGQWFEILGTHGNHFAYGQWKNLDPFHRTPITRPISNKRDSEPQFRLDDLQGWILGPGLLATLAERFKPPKLASAGRMLLLHEALHHGTQRLHQTNAESIRLHPRVIEEVDYLADVWAILHEFVFIGGLEADWSIQRQLLCNLVETAITTMWAFDEGQLPGRLETRRVSRYLIWYSTWVRLEQAASLDDALGGLSIKPIIDLHGPTVHLEDGRLIANLFSTFQQPAEVCLFADDGIVRKAGNTSGFTVESLARALGEHKGEQIKDLVRKMWQASQR